MRAINHALTGALIGLSVSSPIAAGSLALASHFICDALPHYGGGQGRESLLRRRSFALGLIVDALACGVLVFMLAISGPTSWLQAAICAFIAAAPDFAWLPNYLRVRSGKTFADSPGMFTRFSMNIQWFERPIGAVVEVAWFAGSVVLLMAYL